MASQKNSRRTFSGGVAGHYRKRCAVLSQIVPARQRRAEADIDFLSWWEVKGQGTARQGLIFRGIAYDVTTIDRVYISFVVREL